jgi:hypothetical protein
MFNSMIGEEVAAGMIVQRLNTVEGREICPPLPL